MEHFKNFSKERFVIQAKLFGLVVAEDCIRSLPALEFGKKGYATLEKNGLFLHSKHDPIKEAERQLASLKISEELSVTESPVFFFGAGLGYSLELFVKKYKNPVVWIEPDSDVFLLALGLLDIEQVLKEGRITLISPLGPDYPLQNSDISEDTLEKICKGYNPGAITFLNHPASFRSSHVFSRLKERVEAWLNKKAVNLATLARFDRLWMHNLIRNFPILIRGRPIGSLFGKFKDRQAIVCGAGPSLTQDIPLLQELCKDRLLIAVDTACQVLLAHGLVPDFVLCVDPQGINQYYLEALSLKGSVSDLQLEGMAPRRGIAKKITRINFVVDPTVSYLCLRHIPEGQLFYFESPFVMFQLLSRFLKDGAGQIAYGGSVSTNAYDLAIKLGCKKILLFGQDLSFPGKRAHAAGAILEERLLWKENRFFRHEEHNYRQLSALPVRYLSGLEGKQVPTNDKLLIFYQWFEGRFLKDRKNISILDLKSRGARFFALDYKEAEKYNQKGEKSYRSPSFQNTKADDRNASLLPGKGPASRLPKGGRPTFSKAQSKDFAKTLEKLKTELEELGQLCLTGEKLAQECLEGRKEGAAYSKRLKALDQIDEQIRRLSFSSQVAGSAMQRILFSITENLASDLTPEERSNPHLKSAKESLLLYRGLRKASEEMADWLQKSLFLMEQASQFLYTKQG